MEPRPRAPKKLLIFFLIVFSAVLVAAAATLVRKALSAAKTSEPAGEKLETRAKGVRSPQPRGGAHIR